MLRLIFDAPEHANGGCIFDKFRDCRHVFDPPMHANGGCIFDNPGRIDPGSAPESSVPTGGGGARFVVQPQYAPGKHIVVPVDRSQAELDENVLAITMLLAAHFDDE